MPETESPNHFLLKKWSETMPYILAMAPLAWLLWFYLYVVRQRMLLGYWPRPYHPDPKNAGLDYHHATILLTFLVIPPLVLLAGGWILNCRIRKQGYRWWWPTILLATSVAVLVAVLYADPGDFIEWYLD